jgi:hypothetical protein
MIIAVVAIVIPVMGLLVAFDFWHCRARTGRSGASTPSLHYAHDDNPRRGQR